MPAPRKAPSNVALRGGISTSLRSSGRDPPFSNTGVTATHRFVVSVQDRPKIEAEPRPEDEPLSCELRQLALRQVKGVCGHPRRHHAPAPPLKLPIENRERLYGKLERFVIPGKPPLD